MSKPDVPTVNFDHWGPEYAADPIAHNLEYSAKCPVAYSEHHGGFWFVTGYDEVAQVARDDTTFSCHHDLPNGSTPFLGTQHPPTPFRVTPLEVDPPQHAKWRTGLAKLFTPVAVKQKYLPKIREYTAWCIDQCIESGHADLVRDIASPVPSLVNMDVMGVPLERGFEFAELSHAIVYTNPDTPEYAQVYQDYADAVASLESLVHQRRIDPRDDVITALAHLEIDGERIQDHEVMEVLDLVISAGIDTTASALACSLKYLDDHRDLRARLIDEPECIPQAVEEFLRMFSPVQVLARTATRDVELGGYTIGAGERVLISWAAANVDQREFDCPDQIMVERTPNRHAAFGLGIHRCIGSHIARADMGVVLSEILRRMPDYELQDGVEKYGSIGVIQGYGLLPARFTPGPRIGGVSALDSLLAH